MFLLYVPTAASRATVRHWEFAASEFCPRRVTRATPPTITPLTVPTRTAEPILVRSDLLSNADVSPIPDASPVRISQPRTSATGVVRIRSRDKVPPRKFHDHVKARSGEPRPLRLMCARARPVQRPRNLGVNGETGNECGGTGAERSEWSLPSPHGHGYREAHPAVVASARLRRVRPAPRRGRRRRRGRRAAPP